MEAFKQLEDWVATLGLPIAPHVAIISAFATLLLAFVLLFLLVRGRKSKDTILILGLSNSGKTALFERLRDGKITETVTSLKENEQTFVLHSELSDSNRPRPVHIVDFPGHQRLRSQLTTFLPITRGIIFLIDAVEFKAELSNIAQYLFDLFIDKTVNKHRIPFLIVCNKSEIITAKPKEIIQKDLEKEIELCVKNQSKMEDINGGEVKEVTLGKKGHSFEMGDLPFKVTFAECSVKTGDDVPAIGKFIRTLVK